MVKQPCLSFCYIPSGSSGKDTSSDAAQSKVGVAPAPVASPAAMATGNKVQATPAVRRIANEHNVSAWD